MYRLLSARLPLQHDHRFQQFKANLQDIVEFNLANPNASWWAAPNQFTDLSFAEFSQRHLGIDASKARPAGNVVGARTPPSQRRLAQSWPPTVTDWAAAGKTTPVKDQGSVSWAVCSPKACPMACLECLC